MAVLNKIRQRSVFLIIIIALALFAFVLADVIRNGGASSQKEQNTIATINGKEIEREQFARQVEAYQRNLGPNATSAQAMNMVWDMNVRQAVLEEQFEELGIRVEEAQVRAMLRQELAQDPTFTNEAGMFDENRMREYVANIRASNPAAYQQWLDFETSVAKAAREDIYFNMIRAGVGVTLTEGEQAYRFANDNVDLNFVQLPYASVPDSEVEVSKSEIRAYMEKYPKRFQSEATRDIQYVHFAEMASTEDEVEVKNEIDALLQEKVEYNAVTKRNDTLPGFREVEDVERFVNENSDVNFTDRFFFRNQLPSAHAEELFNLEEGETYGPYKDAGSWKVSRLVEATQIPDSAQARHILVSFAGSPVDQSNRNKQEAKQLADSLANVVRRDRSQFADLAAEFSGDASNREEGGDLGWFTPGTFVPAINDFAFTNESGDIGVVETEFGYHVIHIQEQTGKERAVKLATISRAIAPSERSLNDLYTEVTRFEMGATSGDFSEIAAQDNREIRPVREIKALEENIPGIGAQRRIIQWAFEDGTDVGDVRRFEVRDGYVVAQVTGEQKEGLRSVEAASSTVIPILQKQKKAEILKSRISANSLQEIAANQGVQVETASSVNRNSPTLPGVGSEPEVVGTAFALEEGQTSRPVAGNKGVFVVELIRKTPAAPMESYRSYANREAAAQRNTINTDVFTALKNSAEIEDRRARFY